MGGGTGGGERRQQVGAQPLPGSASRWLFVPHMGGVIRREVWEQHFLVRGAWKVSGPAEVPVGLERGKGWETGPRWEVEEVVAAHSLCKGTVRQSCH